MPVLLDWRRAAAPDDLARQTSQALATGALIALPTEAGYVLAAAPHTLADPARPAGLPDALEVCRLDGYFDPADFFARTAPTAAERALATRLWPGPVGWVDADAPFPAWVPAHSAAGAVLAAQKGPLALFELNGGRQTDPAALGDAVGLVVTDGPPRPGPVTLVRTNDTRWSIARPGVMTEAAVREALARRIVFLCTGNTCRSPMAEGLFKRRLADRLGCAVGELPARGFVVTSAGIAALPDDPATPESAAVVRDLGVDLSAHRSRPASADLVARADDVIVMTRSHLLTVVTKYPVLAGALRLLCGPDGDLDDPIGGGEDVYRACAAAVQQHIDRLLTEMGLP
jgi:L-threonylcarbamoyladenylate synthase